MPFVLRMRFANVDRQKICPVLVVVVDFDEISNLAAERRSSVAAENQNERLLADPFVEVMAVTAIEREHADVRRTVSDVEIAFMPLRERIAKEAINVSRAAHEVSQSEIGSKQQD